ncbi:MAG: DUF1015 domain-containing protein [Polyangiales bacterium]
MAVVAPLKPLRYADSASLALRTAPPYDVISADERDALATRDAHNVVQLILPRAEGAADADAGYAHAAELLSAWRSDGTLVRDETPAYYRYDQTFAPPDGGPRVTRTGFLALVQLRPFSDRVVLPHERTLRGPKEDRLKLFRATRTNLSPGFMLYRDPARAIEGALAGGATIARFTTQAATEYGPIDNVLTKVSDGEAVRAITDHIGKGTLLIADGHHRYETALHYRDEIEAASTSGATDDRAEHRFFMAFLCNEDDPSLRVFPTHRLVHGIQAFSLAAMIERVRDAFEVRDLSARDAATLMSEAKAAGTHAPSLVVVTRDAAKVLTIRKDFDASKHPTLGARPPALRGTDVAILHAVVLEHALGISLDAQAKQTNLTYLKDAGEAVRRVSAGEGDALFLMNATPVAQVRSVAEEGEVMPQKATYFYPKVLTGLAIHTLDPTRRVG